jgi:hypothetical protein
MLSGRHGTKTIGRGERKMNPEIARLSPAQKLMKQAIHEIDDYFGEGVAFKNIEFLGSYIQALAILELKDTLRNKL